jgi:hypothetical protein
MLCNSVFYTILILILFLKYFASFLYSPLSCLVPSVITFPQMRVVNTSLYIINTNMKRMYAVDMDATRKIVDARLLNFFFFVNLMLYVDLFSTNNLECLKPLISLCGMHTTKSEQNTNLGHNCLSALFPLKILHVWMAVKILFPLFAFP